MDDSFFNVEVIGCLLQILLHIIGLVFVTFPAAYIVLSSRQLGEFKFNLVVYCFLQFCRGSYSILEAVIMICDGHIGDLRSDRIDHIAFYGPVLYSSGQLVISNIILNYILSATRTFSVVASELVPYFIWLYFGMLNSYWCIIRWNETFRPFFLSTQTWIPNIDRLQIIPTAMVVIYGKHTLRTSEYREYPPFKRDFDNLAALIKQYTYVVRYLVISSVVNTVIDAAFSKHPVTKPITLFLNIADELTPLYTLFIFRLLFKTDLTKTAEQN